MKKVFATLIAAVIALGITASAVTDSEFKAYKDQVLNYVKVEGYVPSFDEDGDIEFKYNGDIYWVTFSTYDDGYYVTLMTMTNIEDIDINKIRKAMDETMRGLKFVRQYTTKSQKSTVTSYSWYCENLKDFKRMFSNALSVVSTAESDFVSSVVSQL